MGICPPTRSSEDGKGALRGTPQQLQQRPELTAAGETRWCRSARGPPAGPCDPPKVVPLVGHPHPHPPPGPTWPSAGAVEPAWAAAGAEPRAPAAQGMRSAFYSASRQWGGARSHNPLLSSPASAPRGSTPAPAARSPPRASGLTAASLRPIGGRFGVGGTGGTSATGLLELPCIPSGAETTCLLCWPPAPH